MKNEEGRMKKCKDCKYFMAEYVCAVPLYVDAEFFRGRHADAEDAACALFEDSGNKEQEARNEDN